LHTFKNKGTVRKRRIRFLTDAKIGVSYYNLVVCSVVFAVVLHVVGYSEPFFEKIMALDRNRDLPMGDSGESSGLSDKIL
jgi:hypothetical protein